MRMIPAVPHGTNSRAERRVFDRLRAAFADDKQAAWTAYHSLNLPRHAKKRFGEIDFLICGPLGIFVLEVKGGRVACREGMWEFTDRYGEVNRKPESPFRQAETALHGLIAKLGDILPRAVMEQFVIGYGAVFPDCDWPGQGAEWDPEALADAKRFREFDRWLHKLVSHWREKDGRSVVADSNALKLLRQAIRPEFEAIVPLHVMAGHVEQRVSQLTEDQLHFVDVVEANPRVICSGGAGTGKTFLALELARRWTSEGKNVALVCHSPWLKAFLDSKFKIQGLTTTLVGSMQVACRRAGIARFDALIVDEGQDLLEMDALCILDENIGGGLSGGNWCFFHDANNQSGISGKYDVEAYDYLSSLNCFRVPLRTNCRNSLPILGKVQESLGADMGVCGVGAGPTVREIVVSSKEEGAVALAGEISALIDREGILPGSIVILSPLAFHASTAALLQHPFKNRLIRLDESALRDLPAADISFAQIENFKGLESEAVVIVDLPTPTAESRDRVMHYVGMSRARAILSLICNTTTDLIAE